MIVRFGIAPSSVAMSDLTLADQLAAHRRALDVWRNVGALAVDASFERQAVPSLPQHARKLWEVALKAHRKFRVDSVELLETAKTMDELSTLQVVLDVGCIGQEKWGELCQHEDQTSMLAGPSGPEVCSFRLADQAERFRSARTQAREPIQVDEVRRDVWTNRFAPHLRFARGQATIVDRYALSSHCLRKNGLGFVLNKLAAEGIQKVTVFSAVEGRRPDGCELTEAEIVESAEKLRRPGGRALSIEIFLGDNNAFSKYQHFRYLRFDQTVCRLDTGLTVFNDERVRQRCECAFEPTSERTLADETELRKFCRRYPEAQVDPIP